MDSRLLLPTEFAASTLPKTMLRPGLRRMGARGVSPWWKRSDQISVSMRDDLPVVVIDAVQDVEDADGIGEVLNA